jgi:hypothetical protein
VIVNTHFLPAEIIASLRKQEKLDVPQATVTTDFETHRLWVCDVCEHYFTATEEGALGLTAWGVPFRIELRYTEEAQWLQPEALVPRRTVPVPADSPGGFSMSRYRSLPGW